jgi:hypothetical protein
LSTLPDELFSIVERLILAAREAAETAAEAAINNLAVNRPEPYSSMDEPARKMRRTLRAKARQLGGGSQTEGLQPLIEEMAYQQWHRMLFARFLAENDLLMHPSGVAVSLEDCAELATEENEADAWAVAAKYASNMLPGIFRLDDPVVSVRFAPEGQLLLERILDELPQIAFTTDDSLGWMYQFWQSKKKAEVNASERKIGGADLAPVTQLFTENYMVRFLLENSLGAWWAGKYPDSPELKDYDYLRYKEDGTPAAGVFEGWPQTAEEVTVMDPCCGSGHFLVAAFEMLREMRMAEEGLDAREAGDVVLRDNLHGLELDLRATQIAGFSVALMAWKTGGYRELPTLNIACSGIPVQGSLDNWLKLAKSDERLKRALTQLYQLFENAPTLGSLINPAVIGKQDPMFTATFDEIEPLLKDVLGIEKALDNFEADIFGNSAIDVVRASKLLAMKFSLVSTNVPYLKRGNQEESLLEFCEDEYPDSKADLATVFLERCQYFLNSYGSYAVVSPQNWLSQGSYEELRKTLLINQKWNLVIWLGAGAFGQISGEVVKPSLLIFSNERPSETDSFCGMDISDCKGAEEKRYELLKRTLLVARQNQQLANLDNRIILGLIPSGELLKNFANSYQGLKTGDDPKYRRYFWEINFPYQNWKLYQTTTNEQTYYGGRMLVINWKNHGQDMARKQGVSAWKKDGVAINQMGNFPATLYSGDIYDSNLTVIIPNSEIGLSALWAFCKSSEFKTALRKIDKGIKVTNSSFTKVPFDLEKWQKVAEEKYPNDLPKPYSNDPTQWLFSGYPIDSAESLQVAVTRLLGYCWPEQGDDNLASIVDEDGIVPLVSAGREIPAADRLRELLDAAYGDEWSADKQAKLLANAGFVGKSLDDWLRDSFFKQHVKLFKKRPFIWHIWDGRKDGFHALVNYHKLDTAALDRLIYTYLGSWIELQRGQRNFGEPGADGRLVAALELKEKLEAIREGQPPYDIYVRWKTFAEQPIGWNPDLNDGVRMNIRPFVTAGVLRNKFTVHWNKDRGKNPDGSERLNDLHFTNEEKLAAQGKI